MAFRPTHEYFRTKHEGRVIPTGIEIKETCTSHNNSECVRSQRPTGDMAHVQERPVFSIRKSSTSRQRQARMSFRRLSHRLNLNAGTMPRHATRPQEEKSRKRANLPVSRSATIKLIPLNVRSLARKPLGWCVFTRRQSSVWRGMMSCQVTFVLVAGISTHLNWTLG